MLDFYSNMSQTQKNTFSDVCNKLLANTFLAREKKDNKESYYFILSFKEVFVEFFGILNYELIINNDLGTIMLQGGNTASLLRLRRDETIILLIFRILYHEKLKEASLNENIVIKIDDIHDKYDYLEIKKRINKTDLIASLRLFRKYNIIEVIDDINSSTARVVIFPTILEAINTNEVNEVYKTIQKVSQEVTHEKAN